MTKRTKELMSVKTIEMRARGLAKTSKDLAWQVHNLAVETIRHIIMHGDTTPALTVLSTLKDSGIDCAGLLAWLQLHGQCTLKSEKTESGLVSKLKLNKDRVEWNLDAAIAEPFFQAREKGKKEAKPAKPASAKISTYIKAITKLSEDDSTPANLGLAAAIKALETAMRTAETFENAQALADAINEATG